MGSLSYRTRPALTNDDLNDLFGRAYNKTMSVDFQRILGQSLTWIGGYDGQVLHAWINVAWDGFVHAFLVDRTAVDDPDGAIRSELVREAIEAIRRDHPTVFKIHTDCRPDELDWLGDLGLQELPGGIVLLQRA